MKDDKLQSSGVHLIQFSNPARISGLEEWSSELSYCGPIFIILKTTSKVILGMEAAGTLVDY
jgi:hypothetical protein